MTSPPGTGPDPADRIARIIDEAPPLDVEPVDDDLPEVDDVGPLAPVEEGEAPQPQDEGDPKDLGREKSPREKRRETAIFKHGMVRARRREAKFGRFPKLADCAQLDQSDTDNARRMLAHFGENLVVRRQEGGRSAIWVTWSGRHWDDAAGSAGATRYAQRVGPTIRMEADLLTATRLEQAALDAAAAAATELAALIADEKEPIKEYWTKARIAEKRRLEGVIERGEAAASAITGRQVSRRKFGISSKNSGRIESMLKMAAPHRLVPPEDFNADPLKVATPTETLRFVRERDQECPDPDTVRWTARLEVSDGHRRDDMITKLLTVSYRPDAKAPKWLAFMERFQPEPDKRRFVQVTAALGLIGLTEQLLVFHYGNGANGKSVFLEVISRVLGPLAVSLPAESISGDNQRGGAAASPDIARLFGARFVRVAEMPEGTPLQEDLVKKLTGGERFPVRNLFEGFFEFDPVFIAHMSGNGYPRINGTDNGIWRRMAVVLWPVTLAREEQRNFFDVVAEFEAEAEGILAWLVEGALIYLAEGLVRPEAVTAETKKYQDEMDPVGRFFDACVTKTGNEADTVTGANLYRAYQAWSEASGQRPVTQTRFGRDAAKKAERRDGNTRVYLGIKLHDVPAAPRNPDDGGSPGDEWPG